MKVLRKNIDLDQNTILVLQMEATAHGHGSLKPFLEEILNDRAARAIKANAKFYARVINASVESKPKRHRTKAKRKQV